MVGWRISQLNSMFVDPSRILSLFRDPPNGNISEVYNSKLAQAHVAAENRLSPADVLRLCGETPVAEEDKGPCYLGADVGSLIHCVIGRKNRSAKPQIVYTGSFPEWAHLETLMRRFKVVKAVIDALPETRKAREFARKYPGKVSLCYYSEHQKGGYSWNESEQSVACNRTEALDASHAELASGGIVLPRECDTLHEFARQCSNVARVLQTDPETGLSRYTYLKTGPDHYRHAQSYECMARQSSPEFLFPFI